MVFFPCLLAAAATIAAATAQIAPRIQANGQKITVFGSDLEVQTPGANAPAISVAGIRDALTLVREGLANTTTTAAAIEGRLVVVESRAATMQATLINSSAAADARDARAQQQIEALQGQVLELAAAVATKAEMAALTNLERTISAAMLANSTAMVQALTACHTRGGTYSVADRSCTVATATTRAFPCQGRSLQRFAVPAGVTSVHARLWGGGGSGSAWNTGGAGGYVDGDIVVTPGETLQLAVACPPQSDQVCLGTCGGAVYTGGWPGTDDLNLHGSQGVVFAASPGGGFSGIFRGQMLQSNAVAVAGGGGGGGAGFPNHGEHKGGAAGGVAGDPGTVGAGGAQCDFGSGGTQTEGGSAGCRTNGAYTGMTPGTALAGGIGDDGGAGGAGWYGGGGGSRAGSWVHGGGGGGSSWIGGMENATTAMGHLNTPAAASTVVAEYIAPVARGGAGTVGGAGMVVISYTTYRII